jgi:hypothetical protein
MTYPLSREIGIEPALVRSMRTGLDGQHPRIRVLTQPPSDQEPFALGAS